MTSFFEKLKKGMGIEISEEGEEKEEKLEGKSPKENKLPTGQAKPAPKKRGLGKLKVETELVEPREVGKIEKPEKLEEGEEEKKIELKKEKWFEPARQGSAWQSLGGQEGQLAVDVYQTDTELVIQSTIAGVKPEDLDISIEADTVLIKGSREHPQETGERNYFYQECYWGPFSRQIILPEETDPNRAEATMKEGVLTIRIPKIERKKKRKITVKG